MKLKPLVSRGVLAQLAGRCRRVARSIAVCSATISMPVACSGCGEILQGLGGLFGSLSNGLNVAGSCIVDLVPPELNGVFAQAAPTTWTGDVAQLTDAEQPDVSAYYADQLGDDILPRWYDNERFYNLGAFTAGQGLSVDILNPNVIWAYVYDASFRQIASWETHDPDGQRRQLEITISTATDAVYLRVNLAYLSDTDEAIVRVQRRAESLFTPEGQTVVLHFGGAEGVSYRSGWVQPTNVLPLTDATLRDAALAAFRETYAPYNVTVLTDEDPTPDPPFTTIYIGAIDPRFGNNGIAEFIDGNNQLRDDIAIIDVNASELGLSGIFGPQTHGRAIGKVAAHEMGHLLGLVHVWDPDALMSPGCEGAGWDVNRLIDRDFRVAPVATFETGDETWALGYQDAPAYLLSILGPAPAE